jgi:hypothetical protein
VFHACRQRTRAGPAHLNALARTLVMGPKHCNIFNSWDTKFNKNLEIFLWKILLFSHLLFLIEITSPKLMFPTHQLQVKSSNIVMTHVIPLPTKFYIRSKVSAYKLLGNSIFPFKTVSIRRCSTLSSRRLEMIMRRRGKRPISAGWQQLICVCRAWMRLSWSLLTFSLFFKPCRSVKKNMIYVNFNNISSQNIYL